MNVWTALFSVAAAVAVAVPFILPYIEESPERSGQAEEGGVMERINQIKQEIREIETDLTSGKLSAGDYRVMREELSAELDGLQEAGEEHGTVSQG